MTTEVTRLHISPLTPTLLDSILAPSVRPLATDISFHTIQTFSENSYGYINLPSMEADKLKKKLNGSILKGKKMKVEAARPTPEEKKYTDDPPRDTKSVPVKTSRKRKAEDGVLEGYELPPDRKVKRGWTEPVSAKKDERLRKAGKNARKDGKEPKIQAKSKHTEKAECLFRTKTPPNLSATESTSNKGKKSKKSAPNEVVVHEFSQTVTHPSFIKSVTEGETVTAEFVEGKGWVDEDGNVREAVSDRMKKETYRPGKKEGARERVSLKMSASKKESKKRKRSSTPEKSSVEEESDWTSPSGTTDDSSELDSDEEETNSSDTSDEEDDPEFSPNESGIEPSKPQKPISVKAVASDGEESDSPPAEGSEKAEALADKGEVHPLEALFKRPASSEKNKLALEVNTGFSFFGEDYDDDDETKTGVEMEPLTPFTQKDRQFRGVRSAAPTPDTALPSRTASFAQDSDEEMDDTEEDDEDASPAYPDTTPSKTRDQPGSREIEESEFTKWFWEHRGENNRAWKRRRREAAKQKRRRENRWKGMKGRG